MDISGALCIHCVRSASRKAWLEICGLLDHDELVSRLKETNSIELYNRYLEVIGEANKQIQQKLLKLLDDNDEEN